MITFHTSLTDEFVGINETSNLSETIQHDKEIPKLNNVSATSDIIQNELLDNIVQGTTLVNNQKFINRIPMVTMDSDTKGSQVVPIIGIENGNLSNSMLDSLNNYKYGFSKKGKTKQGKIVLGPEAINIVEFYKDTDEGNSNAGSTEGQQSNNKSSKVKAWAIKTAVSQSLFNPLYGVKTIGPHTNLPLLDCIDRDDYMADKDSSDCSILKLLQLSSVQRKTGTAANVFDMGFQFYRLSDFMYCKHLGQVSNNHLITLRRYATPIGDNIYGVSRSGNRDNAWENPAELGHLVTWFGTEDNKLSDIFKFNYHATFVPMNANLDIRTSKADDPSQGILGMISNFNGDYFKSMNGGFTGTNNPITKLFSNFSLGSGYGVNWGGAGQNSASGANSELLGKYDTHKIYEPKDTIRENHYYEGKLLFEQSFTLNFSYKLNAYNSINGKAAMLDLIANILRVTYTRGKFWGGENRVVGAPHNQSGVRKMDAFIENAYDKLEGFAKDALSGGINWGELIGSISNALSNAAQAAVDAITHPKETLATIGGKIKDFWEGNNIGDAIKGGLKNALGRPALYAFSSIVHGDNTGLWHLTVGNPRNPILCIGNLILENAEISASDAPLGLDDFPTEIKLTVSLKHAKPRDMIDIQRMFTKGEGSIYIGLQQHPISDFYDDSMINAETLTYDNYNSRTSLTQTFGTNNIGIIQRTWNEIM